MGKLKQSFQRFTVSNKRLYIVAVTTTRSHFLPWIESVLAHAQSVEAYRVKYLVIFLVTLISLHAMENQSVREKRLQDSGNDPKGSPAKTAASESIGQRCGQKEASARESSVSKNPDALLKLNEIQTIQEVESPLDIQSNEFRQRRVQSSHKRLARDLSHGLRHSQPLVLNFHRSSASDSLQGLGLEKLAMNGGYIGHSSTSNGPMIQASPMSIVAGHYLATSAVNPQLGEGSLASYHHYGPVKQPELFQPIRPQLPLVNQNPVPSCKSEFELYRLLERANLLQYFPTFLVFGGDDVQQLCDADEEEFLEIMNLVGMTRKPLHVRRLQKALIEWRESKWLAHQDDPTIIATKRLENPSCTIQSL